MLCGSISDISKILVKTLLKLSLLKKREFWRQIFNAFHGLRMVWWLWCNNAQDFIMLNFIVFGPFSLSGGFKNYWLCAFMKERYINIPVEKGVIFQDLSESYMDKYP